MSWIDETYSELKDNAILAQSDQEIIIKALCRRIREVESDAYRQRMSALANLRQVHKLKKELRDL